QGSGIGLHLTQMLVKKHGGKVAAENRTDKTGSRFLVQIPLGTSHLPKIQLAKDNDDKKMLVEKPPVPLTAEPVVHNIIPHKTNFKVLVVDDEKDILRYVSQELQSIYKIIS